MRSGSEFEGSGEDLRSNNSVLRIHLASLLYDRPSSPRTVRCVSSHRSNLALSEEVLARPRPFPFDGALVNVVT